MDVGRDRCKTCAHCPNGCSKNYNKKQDEEKKRLKKKRNVLSEAGVCVGAMNLCASSVGEPREWPIKQNLEATRRRRRVKGVETRKR